MWKDTVRALQTGALAEVAVVAFVVAFVLGAVEAQNVSFAYPSRPEKAVLDGVSFRDESSERIAFVGQSGAGKSTLFSLLLRFYDPQDGALLIDGDPVAELSLATLRGAMALVPQDVLLFGGSVGENIGYGNPEATREEIEEAARKAHAHEFISEFPEGYETAVGPRGVKLSGGQNFWTPQKPSRKEPLPYRKDQDSGSS